MLYATFSNFWVLWAQMLKIGTLAFQYFSQIFPLKLYNTLTLSNPYIIIIYAAVSRFLGGVLDIIESDFWQVVMSNYNSEARGIEIGIYPPTNHPM